jgi:small membrane protein
MMMHLLSAAGSIDPGFPTKPQPAPIVFQLLLTASLLGVGLYAVALRRRIPMLGNIAALAVMAAMVLAWKPEFATKIANTIGVGRGADLIFYCWVVISLVMILNLHFRIRHQTDQITELVRQLSLQRPVSTGEQGEA